MIRSEQREEDKMFKGKRGKRKQDGGERTTDERPLVQESDAAGTEREAKANTELPGAED